MRERLEARPLWACVTGYTFGVACQVDVGLGLGLLVAIWFFRPLVQRGLIGVWAAVGFLAMLSVNVPFIESRTPFSGAATIVSPPVQRSFGWTADVETNVGRLRMTAKGSPLSLGDQIIVKGQIGPLSQARRTYLATLPTRGSLRADAVSLRSGGPVITAWADAWRLGLARMAEERLSPRSAALLMAICFNQDHLLSQPDYEALQRTGIVHLVSASGVHVAVVGMILFGVLQLLFVPREIAVVLVVLGLGFFAIAAGLEAPIVRSCVFCSLYLSAYLFRRNPDLFQATGVAFFVEVLRHPSAIFDIGVQLSYVTVLGMILFGTRPKGEAASPLKRSVEIVKSSVWISCVAWVASIPLTSYYFGSLALFAVPMNVAITALASPLLIAGLASACLIVWATPVASWILAKLVAPLSETMWAMIDWGSRWEASVLSVPPFHPLWLALIYGLFLMRWHHKPKPI